MRCIFSVIGILLLFSCGSGEEAHDMSETEIPEPNYFPNTLESRWVYRNPEGEQLTWQVVDEKSTNSGNYSVLNITPIDPTVEQNFLIPTYFRLTEDKVFFDIQDKIEQYMTEQLPLTFKDEFEGLDVDVVVDAFSEPEFLFLPIPLVENVSWDTLNLNVNGNFVLQDLILVQIPIELQFTTYGKVVGVDSLTVPAGFFENVIQILYNNEITHTAFSRTETTQFTQTIWYVPHVGIVRIENEYGITELIEYSVLPTISEQ